MPPMTISLIVLSLALCIALIFLFKKTIQVKTFGNQLQTKYSELEEAESTLRNTKKQIEDLQQHVNALAKYEGVVDTDIIIKNKKQQFVKERKAAVEKIKAKIHETKAKINATETAIAEKELSSDKAVKQKMREASEKYNKIITGATQKATRITTEAERECSDLTAKQGEIKKEIALQVKEANRKRELIFISSAEEAEQIVSSAKQRAEEVAGHALKVAGKEEQLAKAVQAMKNTIKGYGEEYVIPPFTILDELADRYEFKEAGRKLKSVRERVKMMVKNDMAATCDYVEKSRRTTAIHFVLDAFNGKVETILTRVRHDNYGKLKQQILDSFNLVNHNGAAFRDARIKNDYLNTRLEELKWAVAVYELKLRDREEQRRIKEEIREEAKAKKEFEKAVKEAAKEEKLLQQAMEKARQELSSASEAQKALYESQLSELEEKLHAAEEKNQRALSMAQQTRRGHVYVISNEGSFGDSVVKIGLTRRLDPMDRVKELGDASVPFPFDVHAIMYSEDSPALEKALHKRFNERRVNKINLRKEFFQASVAEIKEITKSLGIEAQWSMAAEAREYHESLAIAKAQTAP